MASTSVTLSVARGIGRLEAQQRGVTVLPSESIEPAVTERLGLVETGQPAPLNIGMDQLETREARDGRWYIIQRSTIDRSENRVPGSAPS